MKIKRLSARLSFIFFHSLFVSSLLNFSIPTAVFAGTTVTDVHQAFALRCRDLEIQRPYARGYLEWTSKKYGSPPWQTDKSQHS